MDWIVILNNFSALATLVFGLWAFAKPKAAARLLYLDTYKQYGISEIRSTYGAWMLGMGGFALFCQNDLVFMALGVAYLVTALGRSMSFGIDGSFNNKTIKFVLFEITMGLLAIV